MNSNAPTSDPAVQIELMEQRIQQLQDALSDQTRAQSRRRKIILFGGTLVFLLSFISLSSLTADAAKLDAPTVMQIVRQRLEEQLPDRREELRKYLEAQAPTIISTGLETLVSAVPEIRVQALEHMESQLEPLNQELEEKLVAEWKKNVEETRGNLDLAFPNATDEEQLRRLISTISEKFKRNAETTLDAMYPQYTSEMSRIHAYLIDLQNKAPSDLTEAETLHKEIIVTLLRLAVKSRDK